MKHWNPIIQFPLLMILEFLSDYTFNCVGSSSSFHFLLLLHWHLPDLPHLNRIQLSKTRSSINNFHISKLNYKFNKLTNHFKTTKPVYSTNQSLDIWWKKAAHVLAKNLTSHTEGWLRRHCCYWDAENITGHSRQLLKPVCIVPPILKDI